MMKAEDVREGEMKTAEMQTETIQQQLTALAEVSANAGPGESVRIAPRRTGRPRVVIVGAGFGGINAARKLAKSEVDVLLVDKNNYHYFSPLLYQVATAGLEPESIACPVRAIFRKYANSGFRM